TFPTEREAGRCGLSVDRGDGIDATVGVFQLTSNLLRTSTFALRTSISRRQQRNIFHRRRRWPRLQECVDACEVLVRDHLRGERRHVARRIPHVSHEARKRNRVGTKTWALRSALRIVDVALVTAVLLIERRAGISRCRVGCFYLRRGPLGSAILRRLRLGWFRTFPLRRRTGARSGRGPSRR